MPGTILFTYSICSHNKYAAAFWTAVRNAVWYYSYTTELILFNALKEELCELSKPILQVVSWYVWNIAQLWNAPQESKDCAKCSLVTAQRLLLQTNDAHNLWQDGQRHVHKWRCIELSNKVKIVSQMWYLVSRNRNALKRMIRVKMLSILEAPHSSFLLLKQSLPNQWWIPKCLSLRLFNCVFPTRLAEMILVVCSPKVFHSSSLICPHFKFISRSLSKVVGFRSKSALQCTVWCVRIPPTASSHWNIPRTSARLEWSIISKAATFNTNAFQLCTDNCSRQNQYRYLQWW